MMATLGDGCFSRDWFVREQFKEESEKTHYFNINFHLSNSKPWKYDTWMKMNGIKLALLFIEIKLINNSQNGHAEHKPKILLFEEMRSVVVPWTGFRIITVPEYNKNPRWKKMK